MTTTAFRSTARPRFPTRSTRSRRFRSAGWNAEPHRRPRPRRSVQREFRSRRAADRPTHDRLQDDDRLRLADRPGTSKAHGEALGADEVAGARGESQLALSRRSSIPDDILLAWRRRGQARRADARRWRRALAELDPARARRVRAPHPRRPAARTSTDVIDAYKKQARRRGARNRHAQGRRGRAERDRARRAGAR